jgi:hypothetical protein
MSVQTWQLAKRAKKGKFAELFTAIKVFGGSSPQQTIFTVRR